MILDRIVVGVAASQDLEATSRFVREVLIPALVAAGHPVHLRIGAFAAGEFAFPDGAVDRSKAVVQLAIHARLVPGLQVPGGYGRDA